MKIAIGFAEIAGILKDYSEAFESQGLKVTSITSEPNRFYNFRYNIDYSTPLQFIYDKQKITNKRLFRLFHLVEWCVKRFIGFFVFFRLLVSHDVFLYQWTVLFNQGIEYKLLKLFNKKIITVFLGSDVRHISAFHQEFKGNLEKWEQVFHKDNLNKKIRYLRVAELYSDIILSVPDQAGLAIRPYYHLQLMMDAGKIPPFFASNDIPYIIHAPSKKGIKGTEEIIATLEKLKAEGLRFDFRLLHNLSNAEVLEELKKADIVIDELHLNGPGKLGLEAMAYGCALATRHLEGACQKFVPPLCNIDPDNLYLQVKKIIQDKAYRLNLARSGREYVLANNSPAKVSGDLLQLLQGKEQYDYRPTFFLKEYSLPGKEKVSGSNLRLTAKVLEKWGVPGEVDLDRAVARGLVPNTIKDKVKFF